MWKSDDEIDISPEDAKEAYNNFLRLYEEIKSGSTSLKKLRGQTFRFPENISAWGDYAVAANDRLILEKLLTEEGLCERVTRLVKEAHLSDSSVLDKALLQKGEKKTVYSLQDAKTSEVAQKNPNNIAHILADAKIPGGGMLKGTASQEEMTLRADRDVQLALYAIAMANFYPLGSK
jgi:hypothetical protein